MNTCHKYVSDYPERDEKKNEKCRLLIICAAILFLSCFAGTASARTLSVDDSGGANFTRIQDAINDASMGDMILVYSGVYYENVVVDKSVTLRGIGHPVVDARWSGNAVTLTADGITLEGFDITNAEGSRIGAGIKITSNNNNITANNVCNNNDHGISLLYMFSEDNLIYLNNFIDNTDNVYYSSLWTTTIWNTKEEIIYTYNGNRYISYLGNYWADYDEKYPDAEEIDTTGIWDTPYSIYKEYNKDFYPLMEARERYLP